MDLTLQTFLEKMPQEFLITSLILFSIILISIVYLLFQELLHPIKSIHLIISLVSSRFFLLISILLIYSLFLGNRQFQIPILGSSHTLIIFLFATHFVTQISYYVFFFYHKFDSFLTVNTISLMSLPVLYTIIQDEQILFYTFSIITFLTLIHNLIRSIKQNKNHKINILVFILTLLFNFMNLIKIIYTFNYYPSNAIFEIINKYFIIICFLDIITYLLYFSLLDSIINKKFSKLGDIRSSTNSIVLTSKTIKEKRMKVWG